MRNLVFTAGIAGLCLVTLSAQGGVAVDATAEKHLRNIRQLTHGGENAEAYFSPDGKRLIFQSTRTGVPCD